MLLKVIAPSLKMEISALAVSKNCQSWRGNFVAETSVETWSWSKRRSFLCWYYERGLPTCAGDCVFQKLIF